MKASYLYPHEISHVLEALFAAQPLAALDVFLLPAMAVENRGLFTTDFGLGNPVESMDPAVLRQWADLEPSIRYPLLSRVISMFTGQSNDASDVISPLFLDMLDQAPDKRAFLGDLWRRFQPDGWSGSLADILAHRKSLVLTLRESPHAVVRQWVDDMLPALDRWIEQERCRDREGEESFE